MAVTPVSLGPSLRAWALAGLSHVLFDAPLSLPALERRHPSPGGLFRSGSVVLPSPGIKGDEVACPEQIQAAEPAPAAPLLPSSEPKAVPALLVFAPRGSVPRDPASWPEPWNGCFANTVGAPILWTYHELGADLMGVGRSSERSAFLKSLIMELHLPRGSSVFWPCAVPFPHGSDRGALRPNAAVFAAGVEKLRPQAIIVFGETAMADMGLDGVARSFGQIMVEGKVLLLLPDIAALLQGDAQRSSAISLLRALFASLVFD